MGNQKFRLSDMVPNAWFYKLKYMSKTTAKSQSLPANTKLGHHHPLPPPPPPPSSSPSTTTIDFEPQCQSRKSYYITRELPENPTRLSPPRKSKSINNNSKAKKSSRKKCTNSSSNNNNSNNKKQQDNVSATCTCHSKLQQPHSLQQQHKNALPSKTGHFDIFINVDKSCEYSKESLQQLPKAYKISEFNLQLPPVLTKPKNDKFFVDEGKERKGWELVDEQIKYIASTTKELHRNSPPSSRRLSVSSPGMKLRINSPKIMGLKQVQNGGRRSTSKKRRSISESFAVIKSSRNPQRDFRESMVEMIVQNNLRASKDLEDLLACYLSLNSDEYHDVIIKVFKQIWFDLISDIPRRKR